MVFHFVNAEFMSAPKLSTEPYKGTRDFYPEDMFIQKYIFEIMRKTVEQYGYVEYDASILEETALYKAKSGSEIVDEQTYSFTDRGGRDITIRPEMTPTVARMVARKRKELAFPLRWYSIPNLFRYERPQRGRLREHWQLNVDVFGIESIDADVEAISVSYDIMKAFGAQDESFKIRLNNRKLINFLLHEYFKLNHEDAYKLSKLIDRKLKMKEEVFLEQSKEILGDRVQAFLDFLAAKTLDQLSPELQENDGIEQLRLLMEKLEKRNIKNVVFDPSLMRGFDYYTGPVFEVYDTSPTNNRSLFGGGRYDDLVGIFNVEKVPGIGFGMGDVTIRDYLETYELLPKYQSPTDLYICRLSADQSEFIEELSHTLRKNGLNVIADLSNRKLDSQIKSADKQGIPYIIVVGENEAKTKTFKLKNLQTRHEQEVTIENLPSIIKK